MSKDVIFSRGIDVVSWVDKSPNRNWKYQIFELWRHIFQDIEV